MDDWIREETFKLVRDAVAAHPEVVHLAPGPRSTEFRLDLKDGTMRVVSVHIRDQI